LWQLRGAAVYGIGEVDAVRVDVASPRSGLITQLPHRGGGQWTLYDHVVRGDVIAVFDDRQTRLDQQKLQQDVERLFAEVAQWQLQAADGAEPPAAESIGRASEYERNRLAALQTALVDVQTGALVGDALPVPEEAPTLQDETPEELGTEFARLRQARLACELQFRQIRLQSEQLEIRAPISGTLIEVYCWPGQTVPQGAVIATIAADHGRHIVSYVPEESTLQAEAGMPVTIRPRLSGLSAVESEIEQVGRQIRRVPDHQLGTGGTQRWGMPVRIKLPSETALPPGTLVDVVFHRPRR
jgi:multidrug resistance efflux pump